LHDAARLARIGAPRHANSPRISGCSAATQKERCHEDSEQATTARRATPAQRRTLANCHFGSKQGLLESVFLRRAEDLNSERLARLDAVIADARGSAGWKNYFALIAEINNSLEFGGVLMTKTFDTVVQRFIEAIRRALCERSVPRMKRPARRKTQR
jgi:hypothetical protein